MTTSDTRDDVIATIVAAYAARPDVTPDQIVELLAKLKRELRAEAAPAPAPEAAAPTEEKPRPALPIDEAVTRDKVYCLCCGKGFKMLKRHLGAEHGLTEADYRRLFDLPEDMPLVAPSYSEKKADYAKKAGFGKYAREAVPSGRTAGAAQGESAC
ncbi:MucR family transcriptional regulator [Actibacterium sp. MT2.3-13A]|uniref:MucR family transcriptional regulator n=1 Tax=Actibacterium sp. MT2.3-13A TaxID=2828332 RepID=UPI001BAA9081|nr:MucR family transcriptional regulator [Actibacterium sp. MT2.3-13A]